MVADSDIWFTCLSVIYGLLVCRYVWFLTVIYGLLVCRYVWSDVWFSTLQVCLECRDWHPGHTTTDAVVASVQLSKRTIVLVTPNHLDTQWCEYSFDAAHYQVDLVTFLKILRPRGLMLLLT